MPAVPKTPAYFSPYVLRGDTLYVSGNCGMNAQGEFIEGTVQDRTTQAMKNIEAALRANKMELTDIVSVTIYLSKYTEDFNDMNVAYVAMFPAGATMPARSCVGVAALPKGTDVEISCIAVKSQ